MLLAVGLGCARVSVQAPKEPIKVDISMRLDIYQHIAKDIDDIENMVSGREAPSGGDAKGKGPQSSLNLFVKDAYADDGLDPAVEAAVMRRKDRRSQLVALQQSGSVGENKSGLVEVRPNGAVESNAASIVSAENSDRMIIYQAIAKKNGGSVSDVQKLYAKRLQSDAASGTPIEGAQGWTIKN